MIHHLGYLVCRIDQDVIWAESLFVSYGIRRSRVASKLYEKTKEIAKNLGGNTAYNWVPLTIEI